MLRSTPRHLELAGFGVVILPGVWLLDFVNHLLALLLVRWTFVIMKVEIQRQLGSTLLIVFYLFLIVKTRIFERLVEIGKTERAKFIEVGHRFIAKSMSFLVAVNCGPIVIGIRLSN